MTTEQWEKVKEIVVAAADHPPESRSALVRLLAGQDVEVLAEAESLLAAKTATFMPPTRVEDRYRIEKELGRGGFAITYLARDEKLHGRNVVVKVLNHRGTDAWLNRRFEVELTALAVLDHPGVVQPLGAGTLADRRPYIVMQFVDGKPLRDIIVPSKSLPVDRVASLVCKIAEALAAVHAHGITHGDLKPENIMVQALPSGTEEPRLIDFGIARMMRQTALHTFTTHIVGTLRYMAPEQLEGRITPTTDTYALAVVCYEMLTGAPPFVAATQVEMLRMQMAGAEPLPAPINPIAGNLLLQALSVDPSARPQQIVNFAAALEAALRADVTPRTPRRNAVWLVLAAAMMLGAFYVLRPKPSLVVPSPTATVPVPAPIQRIAFKVQSVGRESSVTDMPDGFSVHGPIRFAFTAVESGHLYVFSESENPASLNILFPTPHANQGASQLQALRTQQIPEESFFDVDESSRQRVWVIWSRSPLAPLEDARKWLNDRDRGTIGDPSSAETIRKWLSPSQSATLVATKGEIQAAPYLDPLVYSFFIQSH